MKNRVIILGSGNSISEGLDKGLKQYLENETVISCNYNHLFLPCTIPLFMDARVYKIFRKELKKFPMVVGRMDGELTECLGDSNLFALKGLDLRLLNRVKETNPDWIVKTYERDHKGDKIQSSEKWTRYSEKSGHIETAFFGKDSFKLGFYPGHLCVHLALGFAIACGFEEIFILGMDHCQVGDKTHFYDKIKLYREYEEVDDLLYDAKIVEIFPKIRKQYVYGREVIANNFEDLKSLLEGNAEFYQQISKQVNEALEAKINVGVGTQILDNGKQVFNTSTYHNSDEFLNSYFKPFTFGNTKIFNVSLNSRINLFPKLSYDDFLADISKNPRFIDQNQERERIKNLILENSK